jgi:flagellar protein FlaG
MKINPINSGVSSTSSLGTEAQNRSVEVRGVKPVKQAESTVPVDVKVKNQKAAENEEAFNEEILNKAIAQANKSLAVHNRHIERAVHEVTHSVMYTIKDSVTEEVIMEFPPKKIQDMIAKMWELAGLFVDEKA